MDKKIKLTALGFSFNQTQSGTYGLVLAEEGGSRRIMIIVGTPEAQSIAFILHNAEPPRPLTHDLFRTVLYNFSIHLKEVIIYKYEDGIFFSRLIMIGPKNERVSIESRTSDAIAIALRTESPIYTTETIMRELSIMVNDSGDIEGESKFAGTVEEQGDRYDYSIFDIDELTTMLSEAIAGEDYELASVLRDEIKKKEESFKKMG